VSKMPNIFEHYYQKKERLHLAGTLPK